MGNDKENEIEAEYLRYVLDYLKEYVRTMKSQKSEIDASVTYSRKHFNSDNTEQFTELVMNTSRQEYMDTRLKLSAKSLLKPYFARVDFTADDEGVLRRLYIGKMSLLRDEDDYTLITDWRAPVSSLYYEGRLGRAAYESPDGVIGGEISLKRQYVIENGVMNEFFDIDVTASDDFLQAALGSSKDKRLKDIVSTIQAEQNRVIRANMLKPLIVQGAAGGGKTTIALHRIAYLLYNYEKRLSPKNIMIIAPNRFFLSYISEVLPDLGVENVYQTTFADFALEFMEERLTIKPAWEKLAFLISNPQFYNGVAAISRMKSSLSFEKLMGRYVEHIVMELLPKRDFALGEHCLIGYGTIKKLLCEDYKFLPAVKRLFEVKKYLRTALKTQKPSILKNLEAGFDFRVSLIKDEEPEDSDARRAKITAILNKRDELVGEIEKQSKDLVRKYLKNEKLRPASYYYKLLFADERLFMEMGKGIFAEKDLRAIFKFTAKNISQGNFEEEDLAPLLHLHYALNGNEYFDLRHIVIDEAQDVGLYQLSVLKAIMQSFSFTVLGDLCQGIYEHKGVSDWHKANEAIFGGKGVYETLSQSYRTTVEIMDYANVAISKLKLKDIPLAQPVIRHGGPVETVEEETRKAAAESIRQKLKAFAEKGYRSAAVICKNQDECFALYELLENEGISLLDGREDSYGGGAVILPVYLAKGLEFDGVIIADASEEKYGYSELDIKLLYVAMTRALHELCVVSVGKVTGLLR